MLLKSDPAYKLIWLSLTLFPDFYPLWEKAVWFRLIAISDTVTDNQLLLFSNY